ncbi:MAG: hypothetical protein PQ612_00335 [Rickettsiales bacterium]|nr:hypothetical protein [Pseudomonadota bacterium]MDA0965638.1 hypothetical protein [Pseudomonadota bacterium]MDG4542962.1 hypothetical protein [Rickettsiales bacterium]MDG4544590.1 hypothetical protein [Rickettsiales bacterium]MDG4546712.1 hypothetical protein [Rickettsiales bacterium]
MTDIKSNGHYLLKGYLENAIDIPKDSKTKAITVISGLAAALSSDNYNPFANNLQEILLETELDEKALPFKSLAKQSFDHVKRNRAAYLRENYSEDAFAQTEIPQLVQTYKNPSIIDQKKPPQITDADKAREFLTESVFEIIFEQLSALKLEKEQKNSMPLSDIDDIMSVLTDNPKYLGWQKKDALQEMSISQTPDKAYKKVPGEITFVSMVTTQSSQEEHSVNPEIFDDTSTTSADSIPLHRNRLDRNRNGGTATLSNSSNETPAGQRPALLRRDSRTEGSLSLS